MCLCNVLAGSVSGRSGAGLPEDDERKLEYTRMAVSSVNPFAAECHLDAVVEEVFPWLAARSAAQIMAEREEMLGALEKAAGLMRASGAGDKWFAGCDPNIRQVCLCSLGGELSWLVSVFCACR